MRGTLYGEIHQQLIKHSSNICLVWPESDCAASREIDSSTLLQQIEWYCDKIKHKNFKKGYPVLIAAAPSPEVVAAIASVMRLSGTAVLPPAQSGTKTIFRIVKQQKIKTVILQRKPGVGMRILALILGLRFVILSDIMLKVNNNKQFNNIDDGSIAGEGGLITHSSGSTGVPKTILRPSIILFAQHTALKEIFPPQQGQIDFPLFPNIILHNLACGVKSVVPYIPGFDITKMQPEKILLQIQKDNIQTITGNVFYCRQLLEHLKQHPTTFPAVRAIGIGGSPVPEYIIPALEGYFPAAIFYVIYGSSEAEPIAVRKWDATMCMPVDGYCVGEVYANLEMKINVTGDILLSNGKCVSVGEIVVRGAHVAVASPDEWLHTGDFGYLNEKQLWLTGRKGNEKIHDGVQHYQVEHCLVHMPLVENAAARSDDDGFTLFIQGTADEKRIKQILYTQFKKIKINGIIFRNQLPLDKRHHSKIRYELLS